MAVIKGKWYATRDFYPAPQAEVRFVYSAQPNGERFMVAKVWSDKDGDYESTAMLIAAAPELLEALRKCADRLGEMDCGPELDEARAAIEKATGNE